VLWPPKSEHQASKLPTILYPYTYTITLLLSTRARSYPQKGAGRCQKCSHTNNMQASYSNIPSEARYRYTTRFEVLKSAPTATNSPSYTEQIDLTQRDGGRCEYLSCVAARTASRHTSHPRYPCPTSCEHLVTEPHISQCRHADGRSAARLHPEICRGSHKTKQRTERCILVSPRYAYTPTRLKIATQYRAFKSKINIVDIL